MRTAFCIQLPMFDANAPKKIVRNVRSRSTSTAVPTTNGRSASTRASALSSRPTCFSEMDMGVGVSIAVLQACNAGAVEVPDREFLADAVRTAYLPALLVALAHALHDLSLLRDDLRPDPDRVQEPTA